MVRISKQQERRSRFPRRPKISGGKTGARKEENGFRKHPNALDGELAKTVFIPKID